jgi:hypothetical protein
VAEKYAYTYAIKKIPTLLKHIQTAGIPQDPVNLDYLRKAGFSSSQDRSLIPVMKFVGLLKDDGWPSDHYGKYRDENTGGILLADLIKTAYKPLYIMHPDAHSKDVSILRNFFKTDANVSDEVASRIANTFLVLCGQASFNGSSGDVASGTTPNREGNPPADVKGLSLSGDNNGRGTRPRVDVCVNVQIVIPETADAVMIENIFRSLAGHLGIS